MRKQLAYKLHSQILSNAGITRAQTLEILARMYRFKSLSALDQQGLLIRWPAELSKKQFSAEQYDDQETLLSDPTINESVISFLSSNSNKDNTEAKQVAENILRHLEIDQIHFFRFDDYYDLNLSLDEFRTLSNSLLLACVNKNASHLMYLADFFISFIDEEALNHNHWAKELSSGKTLSEPSLVFAQAYNFSAECKEQAESLLLVAAEKGQAEAMYTLSQAPFNKQNEIWLIKAAQNGHRDAIIDLAYQTGPEFGGIGPWTEKSALAGSFDHIIEMTELALNSESETEINKAFFWYELGKCYGFDITQTEIDNYEDYGPVNITFEGIQLPKASETVLLNAKLKAQETYRTESLK